MFNKSLILAAVAAALANPVLADAAVASSVNPGVAMQAKILGVDPTKFSAADLARLSEARKEGDRVTEDAILKGAVRSGFDSNYYVDGSAFTSNNN